MESSFWHERWEKNEIGFHQSRFHPFLPKYWPSLDIKQGSRVFVPLCGKSRDLLWLRDQDLDVIGVELSKLAVEDFFKENQLTAIITQHGELTLYECSGIRIFCGDFFKLTAADLAGVAGVFDRASLVALPPAMRRDYARHMQKILPSGTQTLLVCFAYPQEQMDGPPFSVEEAEVHALFGTASEVTFLAEADVLDNEPRFKQRGLTRLHEKAFRLRYPS
ncbi:thiopurine S-methyltransferase [Rugosibacter aromaticivorans]|uniref:Thiopurine S-methyltransferase n=1 Tax=Rugosibacter aromaticivorans TaxID=1565605 RepID=A0A0C5J8Z0_9PROT|nr:thiopurine S-methyltransferase [Rugosibacter aromaticivorans]AJP48445.1 thiopurine S-methyltransferase [Rugosibacter aromaticivorans]TBR15307.1 MAG: thiopurine S-methyltransferase [Rugosibacter sp.]